MDYQKVLALVQAQPGKRKDEEEALIAAVLAQFGYVFTRKIKEINKAIAESGGDLGLSIAVKVDEEENRISTKASWSVKSSFGVASALPDPKQKTFEFVEGP